MKVWRQLLRLFCSRKILCRWPWKVKEVSQFHMVFILDWWWELSSSLIFLCYHRKKIGSIDNVFVHFEVHLFLLLFGNKFQWDGPMFYFLLWRLSCNFFAYSSNKNEFLKTLHCFTRFVNHCTYVELSHDHLHFNQFFHVIWYLSQLDINGHNFTNGEKQVAYHLNLCIYNIATDFQYICILLSHMTIKATCHVQKE